MKLDVWKISGDGFHFGAHGLGQEATHVTLASDSLFAALLARMAELHGAAAVDAFAQPFQDGEPPFLISSTFPFAGDVLLLPVPLLAPPADPISASAKDLKRVAYVSEGLFRELLAGVKLGDVYAAAHKLQGRAVLVQAGEMKRLPKAMQHRGASIWRVERRPRVTLGRGVQNSTIFHTGRVSYADGSGLWFGVYWRRNDAALQAQLAELLLELGDAGLGGERSVGFGRCSIVDAGGLELPDAGNKPWVTLSRYLPRPDETGALGHLRAAYRLENVGGWAGSPVDMGQRRRSVNLLVEGAVLGPLARAAPGCMVDVRPKYPDAPDPLGHPVYRYGYGLGVGLEGGDA